MFLYQIIPFLTLLTAVCCSWVDTLDPQGNLRYEQLVNDLQYITDETIFGRDEVSTSTLDALLISVNNSGIIVDTLYEIASNDDEINSLINVTAGLLNGNTTLDSLPFLQNINISINTSQILDQVMSSGLIQSTAGCLLLDSSNRQILANITGELLRSHTWVGQLLNNLGAGKPLTVNMIADTIQHTPNLNPKYNSSAATANNKQQVLSFDTREVVDDMLSARGDYDGSAEQFLNNIINGVLQSQVFSTSLVSILQSLNNTQILCSTAMEVMQNSTILSMFPKLVGGLYEAGAFNNIDTNYYFQYAKKHAILSDYLQFFLTSPTWEPAIAALLLQMEQNGVFQDIQTGLYGPN
ncbi:hypothetical protein PSN45_000970 [Yamadazyma tenuis]|uniref:Nucleotide exchange factor SIL1 n=1 Tax=Candida tenuis (strain ATCC 10573 / BCRC 21748 / CBS 615 / JCM 9827 / NBRC 10315 / NRRL Y-1498 / VKM Y-70) TaxID=590646 RepID=G3B7D5_CANTC|nr:uncharacterized protein CANTEDRAFT_95139 [Yamadazyma tenuis ATCC 10573]EGV62247.1 hypothetical protein CANTEDRAFT_95139 [Yamadazyma tenuis ATCC 10573]WEJ93505.1 hypothetical protein PSN45_000970 [Yamadazyma tenuis]